MSRQNINLGVNANDGTGDNLRDAMGKINDNLIELYSRTGGDATKTGVDISTAGNTLSISSDMSITTNNAGNLTISAPTYLTKDTFLLSSVKINTIEIDNNYNVIINDNVKVRGNVQLGDDPLIDRIALNSYITGSIVPSFNLTFDLGTVSLRYKDVYVGGTIDSTSIYTAGANINGGTINNTFIGLSNPAEGRFTILRTDSDAFLGNLLIRNRTITTSELNTDIEIKPFGTGNLLVTTQMIVGQTTAPIGKAIVKAVGDDSDYIQIALQNLNGGSSSSADFFIPRNDGNDEDNYIDIGINSSTYVDEESYAIHTPGSAYIYTSGADLFVGTYTNNDLILHAGNDMNPSGIGIRIKGDTAHVIIGPGDNTTIVEDTGEQLQVYGVIKTTENIKGGIIEDSITSDFTLLPTKKIYSFTPTRNDVNINIEKSLEETVGSVVIFNNRSTMYNYNLFDADTSSFIVSVESNTAHTLACDSSGWFVVSTI